MREICLARADKTRPVLVLTREAARGAMTKVTVAPITSTVKGLSSEVPVGRANGLDHAGAVSLDNVVTIPASLLGRTLGFLTDDQPIDRATPLSGTQLAPRPPRPKVPRRGRQSPDDVALIDRRAPTGHFPSPSGLGLTRARPDRSLPVG